MMRVRLISYRKILGIRDWYVLSIVEARIITAKVSIFKIEPGYTTNPSKLYKILEREIFYYALYSQIDVET